MKPQKPPQAPSPQPCPNGKKLFEPDTRGALWVQWKTSGPAWSEALNLVKSLEGRYFHAEQRLWTVKDNQSNRAKLLQGGFELPTPPTIGMPSAPATRELAPWTPPWESVEVPDLGLPLRPYQTESLQMLKHLDGNASLFLDPGLGKTLTSLAWLKWRQDLRPALIITTASTKLQWPREVKKWGLQGRIEVLNGTNRGNLPINPRAELVFVNWDILSGWLPQILKWAPATVIADEVQAVGNSSSKRTKAFRELVKGRPLVALSGTPMTSKPAQLWTIAHAMDLAFCGGKEFTYLNRYCAPRPGFGGRMTYTGASNVQELHEKVRNWSIRKTKADVLKDLPDRVYTPVLLDCQMSESYREAENKILSMQGVNTGLLQERLSALTASAYDLKKDALIQWVSEFLEDSDEKLTLFGWHTASLDHLEAHFGKACVRVSGGVSQKDKEAAVSRFRKDASCRVFIGQIASAGVGIDGLQDVCSNVAFAEATWSWSLIDQATSRLHRMGQKNSVTVYYLMAPDTIDEVQVAVLEDRRRMAASILDGKFDFSEDEEAAVLDTIKKLKSPVRL